MSEPVTTEPTTEPAEPTGAQAAQPVDWEAEAKKWEKRSKDNFAKLKEAEPKLAEYEKLRKAQQTDAERQAEELTRWQSEAQTLRTNLAKARIETLAAADFKDTEDAVLRLDPAKYVGLDGEVDGVQIKRDLADILNQRPDLARGPDAVPGPRIPAPNRAQGSGGGAPIANPAAEFGALLQARLNQ